MTYNLHQFAGAPRQAHLIGRDLASLRPSVVAVQEVDDRAALRELVPMVLGGSWEVALPSCGPHKSVGLLYDSARFAHEGARCHGSVQVGNRGLRPALELALRDQESAELWRFFVVHLKAGRDELRTRELQLRSLTRIVQERTQEDDAHVIVLGDFNIHGTPERTRLGTVASDLDLDWATRRVSCTFTGFEGNCRCMALDHVLASTPARGVSAAGACATRPPSCATPGFQASDHCPVIASL